MRKFSIRLILFIIVAMIFDICIGSVFTKIRKMNHGGDVYRINNIMNEMHDEILIMGSSRAVHHYDPSIIEHITGLSCKNCGFDGNGIIMMYGLWKEISKRYYPKILIYDLMPSFDLSTEYDNHRYLSRLKPFYRSNPFIDSIFWTIDSKEKIKMISSTYQYNSNFLDIIAGWVHPILVDNGNGYKPLCGIIDTTLTNEKANNIKITYDSIKLDYFQKLMNETKDKTKLVIVVSPFFQCNNSQIYEPIQKLCKKYKVPFIDYSSKKDFLGNVQLFKDNLHLNKNGACVFTKKIVKEIFRD